MKIHKKVNILGTEYDLYIEGMEGVLGYCDSYDKIIEVSDLSHLKAGQSETEKEIKQITRHEIIHAFLNESGLKAWSKNEEMVDWLASQLPKIFKVFKELDIL